MVSVAQRPAGFSDDSSGPDKQTSGHTSWFAGKEAKPIGDDQRKAFLRSDSKRASQIFQRVAAVTMALAVAGLAVVAMSRGLGRMQLMLIALGAALLAGASAAMIVGAKAVEGYQPRHARQSRLGRRVRRSSGDGEEAR